MLAFKGNIKIVESKYGFKETGLLSDDTFFISDGYCFKEGTCYVGQLSSVGSIKVLNWKECQMRCGANYQCQKWTYLEGTKMCTKISMKYVKAFPMVGCVSGNKFCDGKSKFGGEQLKGILQKILKI